MADPKRGAVLYVMRLLWRNVLLQADLPLSTCAMRLRVLLNTYSDTYWAGHIIDAVTKVQTFWQPPHLVVLHREGSHVNRKHVYHLYHLSCQGVKCRWRRKGLVKNACRNSVRRFQTWPSRWIFPWTRWLLVAESNAWPAWTTFTKECLTITTVFGISGVQVTRILDCIALFQGYPVTIRPEQNPVGQTNVEHISWEL